MSGTVDGMPYHSRARLVTLCLLLIPLACAAGALGAFVERRWVQAAHVDVPRMVSLDVAALLAAMARAVPPGNGHAEERAGRLVEALQEELKVLSANETVVLNAAAVVAGVEDLTPVLKARLLSADPDHRDGRDE